jgi:hypothetical protein
MSAKPCIYFLFLVLFFSCSSSNHEERYIKLLEEKIEELSQLKSEYAKSDFLDDDVISKVKEYFLFTCYDDLQNDEVSVYRNAKKSWLVSIEKGTNEFDEFGFPLVRKITFEVIESEGYLVPVLEIDSELCE